jgi:LPXTG-motif cell wall-anchored protein
VHVTTTVDPGSAAVSGAGDSASTTSTGTLPVTGDNTGVIVTLAALLIASGLALVLAARRRA